MAPEKTRRLSVISNSNNNDNNYASVGAKKDDIDLTTELITLSSKDTATLIRALVTIGERAALRYSGTKNQYTLLVVCITIRCSFLQIRFVVLFRVNVVSISNN
jgi:hypothetical protein